jgi:hypothetical protein
MATATHTPTQEALDELEREAQAKIRECEQEEQRLALDALSDPALAKELHSVQRKRADAEGEARQAQMAREEIARREAQAEAEADEAARDAALLEARELQVSRERAAAMVDKGAALLAEGLAVYAEVRERQTFALIRAGRNQLKAGESAVQQAVVRALHDHDVPPGLIDWQGSHRLRARPFVELDPHPVEPLEEAPGA